MLQILYLHIRRRVTMSSLCHPNLYIFPVLRSGIFYLFLNFSVHLYFKDKILKLYHVDEPHYCTSQLLSYIASMILRHVYLVPGLFVKPEIFDPVLAIHYHGDVDISIRMCEDCRDSVPNIAAVSLSCGEAKHLSPCSKS